MNRNNSLDCLRVLACFLVILLHVSAKYVTTNIDNYNLHFTIGNFFDSFSRACVPLFVMLSGAFLLNNSKNKDFKYFYKKSLKKIFIPTIIWSFIYVLYSYLLQFMSSILLNKPFNYTIPIKEWLMGRPFYHLWYLYMILGLYFMVPIIIIVREQISKKSFFLSSILFLFLGMGISAYQSLIWPLQWTLYIGYFMIGGFFLEYFKTTRFNIFISSSISFFCCFSIFIITELIVKYNILNKSLYFYSNLSPFVIVGSIFLFITFLNLNIRSNFYNKISPHTFNIYVIHAGILTFIEIFLNKILNFNFDDLSLRYIIFMTFFVFFISYFFSIFISFFKFKNKNNNPNNVDIYTQD